MWCVYPEAISRLTTDREALHIGLAVPEHLRQRSVRVPAVGLAKPGHLPMVLPVDELTPANNLTDEPFGRIRAVLSLPDIPARRHSPSPAGRAVRDSSEEKAPSGRVRPPTGSWRPRKGRSSARRCRRNSAKADSASARVTGQVEPFDRADAEARRLDLVHRRSGDRVGRERGRRRNSRLLGSGLRFSASRFHLPEVGLPSGSIRRPKWRRMVR